MTEMKRILVVCAAVFMAVTGAAHAEPALGEVALHQNLLDVGTDLRLMCVAAHPDDEDGATLAMYRKKWGYKTFAVIATRGEGGQNEIGPELYNALGVIRTHEMMRASKITGAELHFLDLPEFGFSKNAEETFRIWGREETLRRMVRKIRETRPDVIITHHNTSGGHGHHRALGITLLEAFDAAADPEVFPEQVAQGLAPWQVARLYLRFFRGADKAVVVEISELDEVRGLSYAELAGLALYEHETQGMGAFVERFLTSRSTVSYGLQLEAPGGVSGAGPVAAPGGGLFDGLHDRVSPQARKLSLELAGRKEAKESVSALFGEAKTATAREQANRLAVSAMQLKLTARISDKEVVPGQEVTVTTEVFDYGEDDARNVTFTIEAADWMPAEAPAPVEISMKDIDIATAKLKLTIPAGQASTIPHDAHLFSGHFLRPQFHVVARVETREGAVILRAPVLVDVAPKVSLEFADAPHLIRRGVDRQGRFSLRLTNHAPGPGEVTVVVSPDPVLGLSGQRISVSFNSEGDQKSIPLVADLPAGLQPRDYTLTARIEGTGVSASGSVRVVDLAVPEAIRVGVIESYDDTFMTTLERLDVPHEALGLEDFTPERLDTFSTIIVDIRAYLVRQDLVANNRALLDYVHRGGTVLVMYQKTYEWKDEFAPYPLHVSRNRVTVEDAPMKILAPDHGLFHEPNTIREEDWAGWIQERGLYFPAKWDDAYTPLLQCADPGEDPAPGSCLVARYGEGTYLYTALGWYRQLRELHPGTLRIFANMLAL